MSEFFTINLPDEYINIMNEIKIDKNMDPFRKLEKSGFSSIDENIYNIIYESIKDVSNHNSDKLAKKCAIIIDKILQLCITKLSQNFTVITININKIDWLYLSSAGHTRVKFMKENQFLGQWIAP